MSAKQYKRNLWYDLTTDPTTGHYVGKDVTKTLCFYAALAYLVFGCVLQWLGKSVDWEPFWGLLTAAGLFQGTKILDTYLNRKTRDSDGALAQRGTETAPATPIVTPQPGEETPALT